MFELKEKTMKKTLRQFLFSLVGIFSISFAYAQTTDIEYKYDDIGNRILRGVVELPIDNKSAYDSTKKTKYWDLADTTIIKFNDVLGKSNVTIYPNPNGGQFSVVVTNLPSEKNASIFLLDLQGTIFFHQKIINKITNIDIRNRENGSYILSIEIDGKVNSWKVIKL